MVCPWNTLITLRKLFGYIQRELKEERERDDWTIFPRPHLSIPFFVNQLPNGCV